MINIKFEENKSIAYDDSKQIGECDFNCRLFLC